MVSAFETYVVKKTSAPSTNVKTGETKYTTISGEDVTKEVTKEPTESNTRSSSRRRRSSGSSKNRNKVSEETVVDNTPSFVKGADVMTDVKTGKPAPAPVGEKTNALKNVALENQRLKDRNINPDFISLREMKRRQELSTGSSNVVDNTPSFVKGADVMTDVKTGRPASAPVGEKTKVLRNIALENQRLKDKKFFQRDDEGKLLLNLGRIGKSPGEFLVEGFGEAVTTGYVSPANNEFNTFFKETGGALSVGLSIPISGGLLKLSSVAENAFRATKAGSLLTSTYAGELVVTTAKTAGELSIIKGIGTAGFLTGLDKEDRGVATSQGFKDSFRAAESVRRESLAEEGFFKRVRGAIEDKDFNSYFGAQANRDVFENELRAQARAKGFDENTFVELGGKRLDIAQRENVVFQTILSANVERFGQTTIGKNIAKKPLSTTKSGLGKELAKRSSLPLSLGGSFEGAASVVGGSLIFNQPTDKVELLGATATGGLGANIIGRKIISLAPDNKLKSEGVATVANILDLYEKPGDILDAWRSGGFTGLRTPNVISVSVPGGITPTITTVQSLNVVPTTSTTTSSNIIGSGRTPSSNVIPALTPTKNPVVTPDVVPDIGGKRRTNDKNFVFTPTPTPVPTETVTDTLTPTPVPTETVTDTLTPTPVPTETVTNTLTPTITPVPTTVFVPVVTPQVPAASIPLFGGGLLGRGGGRGSRGFKVSKAYTPSVTALSLGITGKRPSKSAVSSGLGLRPIISSNSKRKKDYKSFFGG